MKRCLAFDVGLVLCHVTLKPFEEFVFENTGITPEKTQAWLEDANIQLDLGIWTIGEAAETLSRNLDRKEATDAWLKCVSISEEMDHAIMALQDIGFTTVFLSNIGYDHRDAIIMSGKSFSIARTEKDNSCGKFFSCEVEMRKPQRIYFEEAVRKYPELDGALYFEDRAENRKAAEGILTPVDFNLNYFENDTYAAKKIYEHVLRRFTLGELPPPSTS